MAMFRSKFMSNSGVDVCCIDVYVWVWNHDLFVQYLLVLHCDAASHLKNMV